MFKLDCDLLLYEQSLYQGGENKLTYDGAPNKKASINFNVCSNKINSF